MDVEHGYHGFQCFHRLSLRLLPPHIYRGYVYVIDAYIRKFTETLQNEIVSRLYLLDLEKY